MSRRVRSFGVVGLGLVLWWLWPRVHLSVEAPLPAFSSGRGDLLEGISEATPRHETVDWDSLRVELRRIRAALGPQHPESLWRDAFASFAPLSGGDLDEADPEVKREIQDALRTHARPQVRKCLDAVLAGLPVQAEEQVLDVSLSLFVVADQGRLSIQRAGETLWPESFDEESQACLLAAYESVSLETTSSFAYPISYPVRVIAPGASSVEALRR